MKFMLTFLLIIVPIVSLAEHTFDRQITEIQVLDDRVRLRVGVTYGTCGPREGWWGWYTSHERHRDWLSLAMVAYTNNQKITLYDAESSCGGPPDAIGLEALYLKAGL